MEATKHPGMHFQANSAQVLNTLVSYTAVISVVTSGGLPDGTKNGCVADYQYPCKIKYHFALAIPQ